MVTRKFDFDSYLTVLNAMSTPFGLGAISSPNITSLPTIVTNIVIGLGVIFLHFASLLYGYKMKDETVARKLLIVLKMNRVIGVSLTILLSFYNNGNFKKVVVKMKQINTSLDFVQDTVNYKVLMLLLVAIFNFFLLVCSLAFFFTLSNTLEQSTVYSFSRIFFECYQIIFGAIFVLYFNFFCMIYIVSYMKVRKMLERIKRVDSFVTKPDGTPLKLLLTASKIHSYIFHSMEYFNKTLSLPLLVLVVNNTLELLVIISIVYNGRENSMDHLNVCTIGLFYILIITPAVIAKQISEQLANILGECNICYTDVQMSLTKNTFLLQLCHQKLNFSIYKIIPLSIGASADIFTFGTTIVIFLFQLLSTW